MTEAVTRGVLATLAILAVLVCLICVTGLALFAVQHTRWDWLSVVLGVALVLLLTAVVWHVLDIVDNWIDRTERARAARKP